MSIRFSMFCPFSSKVSIEIEISVEIYAIVIPLMKRRTKMSSVSAENRAEYIGKWAF